jgi:hypothetical protein
VGVASGVAGAVGANQTRQRSKGIISNAYKTGQERLGLSQLDTRQQVAEQSGGRGLTGGGDVTSGTAVGPGETVGVGGAHTLGGQQTLDLRREQALEQTGMKNQEQAELSGVNETANQSMINAGAAGIGAGVNAMEAGSTLNAMKANPASLPSGVSAGAALSGDQSTPYPGSFRGIDPVNPLGRGAWANPAAGGSTGSAKMATSTSDFNVNG